jgi:hypothetical protein
MSIDHKAYLFRYDEFRKELADVLYQALQTEIAHPLRAFVSRYHSSMTDLATAKSLGEDWEEKWGHEADVQCYADLALTRYYDLTGSLGLSYGFIALAAYLRSLPTFAQYTDCLIGGRLFGPKGKRLDPGQMGTGLLSPEEVARFARLLAGAEWSPIPPPESEIYAECYYQPESTADVQRSLNELRDLYSQATEAGLGILFADFNDRGVSAM